MAVKSDVSEVARQLKTLRNRTGLSVAQVAHYLGYATASGYQHYEDKYKRRYLPMELCKKLKPLFARHGISPQEVDALAGVSDALAAEDASGWHHDAPQETGYDAHQLVRATLLIQEIYSAEALPEENVSRLARKACQLAQQTSGVVNRELIAYLRSIEEDEA